MEKIRSAFVERVNTKRKKYNHLEPIQELKVKEKKVLLRVTVRLLIYLVGLIITREVTKIFKEGKSL